MPGTSLNSAQPQLRISRAEAFGLLHTALERDHIHQLSVNRRLLGASWSDLTSEQLLPLIELSRWMPAPPFQIAACAFFLVCQVRGSCQQTQ